MAESLATNVMQVNHSKVSFLAVYFSNVAIEVISGSLSKFSKLASLLCLLHDKEYTQIFDRISKVNNRFPQTSLSVSWHFSAFAGPYWSRALYTTEAIMQIDVFVETSLRIATSRKPGAVVAVINGSLSLSLFLYSMYLLLICLLIKHYSPEVHLFPLSLRVLRIALGWQLWKGA